MNITVTGNLGSGKSTVCKELEKLGYEVVSTGGIFRQIAAEEGLSVIQLNERVQKEAAEGIHDIDDRIDNLTTKLGREKDNMVFDSRLAWHFVENSFKVFLTVDINTAADRVQKAGRETESFDSLEECRESLLKRQFVEQERFSDLYGINYYNMKNYNLILETTHAAPEQIVEELLRQLKDYEEGRFTNRVLLNPASLYPTRRMGELSREILNGYLADQTGSSYGNLSCGINNNSFYVLDGHYRLLAAHLNKCLFVQAQVDPDAQIPETEESVISEFEGHGKFRYRFYPDREKKDSLLRF